MARFALYTTRYTRMKGRITCGRLREKIAYLGSEVHNRSTTDL